MIFWAVLGIVDGACAGWILFHVEQSRKTDDADQGAHVFKAVAGVVLGLVATAAMLWRHFS